jgi:hypothetical protein
MSESDQKNNLEQPIPVYDATNKTVVDIRMTMRIKINVEIDKNFTDEYVEITMPQQLPPPDTSE